MKKITQVDINIGEQELLNVSQSINDRWLSEGPFCQKLLEEFKGYTGSKYAVFAPNGTLSIFLALLALDLPKGSEVIIPSFTFYGSASPVVYAGLIPVFADVSPDTLHIDLQHAESLVTDKTSAIMPVHIYGQCADMDSVNDFAKKYDLKVLEDAAQAVGVFHKDKHAGTMGDVGIISMFSDKTITMGEGAIVLTNDEELYKKLRLIRNQGRPNAGTFIHPSLGMNFRITDMQAGVGYAQFQKLPEIISEKQRKYDLYMDALKGVGDLEFLKREEHSNIVPFRFSIKTQYKEALEAHLEAHNVQARAFFYPMHMQPALQVYAKGQLPVAEALYDVGMCLPIHFNITDEDITYISGCIVKFFESK